MGRCEVHLCGSNVGHSVEPARMISERKVDEESFFCFALYYFTLFQAFASAREINVVI